MIVRRICKAGSGRASVQFRPAADIQNLARLTAEKFTHVSTTSFAKCLEALAKKCQLISMVDDNVATLRAGSVSKSQHAVLQVKMIQNVDQKRISELDDNAWWHASKHQRTVGCCIVDGSKLGMDTCLHASMSNVAQFELRRPTGKLEVARATRRQIQCSASKRLASIK